MSLFPISCSDQNPILTCDLPSSLLTPYQLTRTGAVSSRILLKLQTGTIMKNASRSKFLLCFRPVVVDMELDTTLESEADVDRSTGTRNRIETIENKKVDQLADDEQEDVNFKAPLTKTMSLDREYSSMNISSQTSKMPRSRQHRTFSWAIKAVFFETILAKRVRDAKALRQDSVRSKQRCKSLSLGADEFMDTTPEIDSTQETKVQSNPEPERIQSMQNKEHRVKKESMKVQEHSVTKTKKNKKSSCDLNSRMYLLLISLGITVFWGRVLAILFTSIWLYIFSWRCGTNRRQPENVTRNWSEAESRDQKRRAIMEGLIERNHHVHVHSSYRGY